MLLFFPPSKTLSQGVMFDATTTASRCESCMVTIPLLNAAVVDASRWGQLDLPRIVESPTTAAAGSAWVTFLAFDVEAAVQRATQFLQASITPELAQRISIVFASSHGSPLALCALLAFFWFVLFQFSFCDQIDSERHVPDQLAATACSQAAARSIEKDG